MIATSQWLGPLAVTTQLVGVEATIHSFELLFASLPPPSLGIPACTIRSKAYHSNLNSQPPSLIT
jgi:hypothetical protein